MQKFGKQLLCEVLAGTSLFFCSPALGFEPVTLEFEDFANRVDSETFLEDGYLFAAPKHPAVVNGGNLLLSNPDEGPGPFNTFPYNGTGYAVPFGGSLAMLKREDGAPFRLHGFDLAEYSATFADPFTMTLTGYRSDGSTISTTFDGDGFLNGFLTPADFERVTLGAEWSSLLRVEMTVRNSRFSHLGYSVDNIAVERSPVIDFTYNTNQTMTVDYAGIIQHSTNMVQWIDLDPQPVPPFTLDATAPYQFLRARDELVVEADQD